MKRAATPCKPIGWVLAVLFGAGMACSNAGQALELRETTWEAAGDAFGLDAYLVYAVALMESRRFAGRDAVAPWPWALRTDAGAVFAKSRLEAVGLLRLASLESSNVDVGIMQISTFWHGHRVRGLADLLEPRTNVHLGARILREAIDSAPGDIELGVGRYHSWNEAKARKYGRAVLQVYANLVRLKGNVE